MSEPTPNPETGGATGTPIPEALLNANPGLSKFKSVESLAQSYSEAQKTLGQKSNEVSDLNKKFDALTQQMTYDPDTVDVPEGARESMARFKEMGVPEDAAKALAVEQLETRGKIEAMSGQYEDIRLESKWGNNTQQRKSATTEWAEANLPESVTAPLLGTAEGMTTLYAMMQAKTAASSVTDPGSLPPETLATKRDQVNNEMAALRRADDFNRNYSKQSQYNALMNQLVELDK